MRLLCVLRKLISRVARRSVDRGVRSPLWHGFKSSPLCVVILKALRTGDPTHPRVTEGVAKRFIILELNEGHHAFSNKTKRVI
jgi:hypothetical protein